MHASTPKPLPPLYRYAPLATFLAVTAVNFLPLGQRRFEDDEQTLVTAADYAFSIWGVIFLGLIGFSVVLAKAAEPDTRHLRRAIVGLLVAGVASMAFVPISIGGNRVLGFADVLVHLLALVYAYRQLRAHVASTPGTRSRGEAFWFYGPSMYLGWISAATVIAASLALEQLGVAPGVQASLALACVLVLVLLAIGRQFEAHADNVYGLTVAWGLVGIGVEQAAFPVLRYLAWAAAATLLANALLRAGRGRYGFYATPGYYEDMPRVTPSRSTTSSRPS